MVQTGRGKKRTKFKSNKARKIYCGSLRSYKTLRMIILRSCFAEDDYEIEQDLQRTCITILPPVFVKEIYFLLITLFNSLLPNTSARFEQKPKLNTDLSQNVLNSTSKRPKVSAQNKYKI